ncbi:MAG TPA: hypothetical protein DCF33_13910, partial [Saprospirales bacterium]|nr:hypothetical protein [Saprospirales bacterium]
FEYPDSVMHEIWKNEQWAPVQKTNHYYQSAHLIGRTFNYQWNEAAAEWDTINKTHYAYDGGNLNHLNFEAIINPLRKGYNFYPI